MRAPGVSIGRTHIAAEDAQEGDWQLAIGVWHLESFVTAKSQVLNANRMSPFRALTAAVPPTTLAPVFLRGKL